MQGTPSIVLATFQLLLAARDTLGSASDHSLQVTRCRLVCPQLALHSTHGHQSALQRAQPPPFTHPCLANWLRGRAAPAHDLALRGRAAAMHGDLDQHTRMAVLAAFKAGTHHVLVATDVAARGLDIRSIKTVVNFDAAKDIETHVHRIGRTGRAGDKEGVAITLVTPKEARFAGKHAACPGPGSGEGMQSALLFMSLWTA